MRSSFVAGLLLAPMLMTVPIFAAQPKADNAGSQVRVTTGVTAPAILNQANIRVPANVLNHGLGNQAKVVLAVNVDEKGNAQNVRVVESANPEVDALVVAGVRESHFRPATLDHQAIPVEFHLVVLVQK